MEAKSKLPTMIKKPGIPTVRAHVPSDRLIATTNGLNKTATVAALKSHSGNRPALTSFENVLNSLRNGTDIKKPTKRHGSPEFRSKKPPLNMAKRLRRSRSVSDIDTVNFVRSRKRFANAFAVPTGPAPKVPTIRVPLAPPKDVKSNATVTKPSSQSIASKKPVASSILAAKKDDDASKAKSKAKAVNVKRIPAYDFKARFQDLSEKHKILKEKHETLKAQYGELDSLPEQYEECRTELSSLQNEYESIQKQLGELRRQSAADQQQIQSLNDELSTKIEECRTAIEEKNHIFEQYTSVNKENTELKVNNSELKTELKTQKELIDHLKTELQEAGEQLFRANIERKDLHNTIMDLRGNIRVFCRIRPPLEGEETRTICSWQHNDETSLEIGELRAKFSFLNFHQFYVFKHIQIAASVDMNKKSVKHEFSFDQVFRPNSIQEDIFELVSPLIQSALDGYNVCIFAYGQTGECFINKLDSFKFFTLNCFNVHSIHLALKMFVYLS